MPPARYEYNTYIIPPGASKQGGMDSCVAFFVLNLWLLTRFTVTTRRGDYCRATIRRSRKCAEPSQLQLPVLL